jgi:hypothetical protein
VAGCGGPKAAGWAASERTRRESWRASRELRVLGCSKNKAGELVFSFFYFLFFKS